MSNHLMDIATQQLVTIARTTAYHCDEQHEYMKGAGGNDWLPHKWVVEAMRAAVTIRNTQAEDMVREELHQARAKLAEAHALLSELEGCPWVVDEATIPKAGIEARPQQVVGTMHVGLMRLRKVRAFLSASAEPSADHSVEAGKMVEVDDPEGR